MQLTFETQPMEDIQINMSTQAENAVNGDISDIKIDLNHADKENSPIIDDGIPEKPLSSKTEKEMERLPTEATNETVFNEEILNGKESKTCNLEVIDIIRESDIINNSNSTVTEIIPNGISNSQDDNVLKCDTTNIAMTTENISETKQDRNEESNLGSSNDENSESYIKTHVNSMSTNEQLPELELHNSNDLSNQTKEITETSDDSRDVKIQKTVGVHSFTNIEKVLSENVSEMTSVVTVDNLENGEIDMKQPEDAATELTKEKDIITSEASKDIVINNEPSTLVNDTIFDDSLSSIDENRLEKDPISEEEKSCTTDIKSDNSVEETTEPKFIAMAEEAEPASIDDKQLEDVVMFEVDKPIIGDNEKTNPSLASTEISQSIAVFENLASSGEKQLEDAMPVVEKSCISENEKENRLLANTERPESIAMDEDVENLVSIDEKQLEDAEVSEVEKSSTNDDKKIPSLIGTEESNPIAVDEEKLVPIAEETVTSIEIYSSGDKQPLAITETNDISMTVPTANDSISAENKELVDDIILESSLNDEKNYESVVIPTETCDKNGLANSEKEVENVSMEIDDIEIVDLEMEKQVENINEDKIISVATHDDKIILKLTSESTENKISFPTNEDVELKDLTDASNENKNNSEIPEIQKLTKDNQENVEVIDEDDVNVIVNIEIPIKVQEKEKSPERKETKVLPVVCKLSNTLDILSDDEEEIAKVATPEIDNSSANKQYINIDDDDDIMLIEEDSNSKDDTNDTILHDANEEKTQALTEKEEPVPKPTDKTDLETGESNTIQLDIAELSPKIYEKDSTPVDTSVKDDSEAQDENMSLAEENELLEPVKPLLPQNFLKTAKKNLADMTRSELEDFCVLRIVESIVDRSNLGDIKTKVKIMSQNLQDYKKRTMMLTKQNRDLQVVLKSVQEEQKKRTNAPIQPLKITRSVGMQVLMHSNVDNRRNGPITCQPVSIPASRPVRAVQNAKVTKPPGSPVPIPVPRKVPVNNNAAKILPSTPTNNAGNKIASPNPNGVKTPSPVQKAPEKRPLSRMQTSSSVTVDLTDDEPPTKINKNAVIPPVRLVPPQNLMPQQKSFVQPLNSPRKVYIPISGPQGQLVRPGQTIMMKSGPLPGPRQRMGPPMPRMQQSPIRINKQIPLLRHPAPLPDAMKQYTPPTWKALPPAPDLKLSKVENGIVISWKIEGMEGGFETIASYQLYAYQETTAPPCTALWKKIGDVKALPLPMACTLTQFMAGFKYYFAVRAVDVRSRLGPFSLPGSILLLSKV